MEGLSEIKDYNSLRAAFLKLDTSYDGKIDKNESEDDVNKYDKDKNDSVELWKYMEAVNQEAKKQIFKNYEIEANKKAYELLGSLEKENKLRLNSACTGIPEAQTCNNYIIPFIGFIERTIELGIERTRILDLSNKLISNSLYSEEKHLKISVSLLRICASNEEILPVLFSKEPILSENLASFLDKMYGLGFGKNEILKYINDLLVKIETVKGFSKAMRKSITVNRAFSEESLETMKELKLLGFENMQTIELMTKSEYYMELDIIKELLVDGMPKKDILRYAVSIGQITENLPKIYKTLMVNEFPEEMAFNFLIDLGKKKNLLILSDFPDVIFSLLKSYGMRKDEAINYLLSLPDDISCFAPLLEKMLSKGWDMSSACGKNVFDFVFEISKKLSEEEKIYLSQQFIATIDKVDAEKAEKNFWTVLSKTANNIESSGKQNLCEVYYLAFFSFALYQGYQNFLSYPQDILKNYIMPLQTQNTKLKLLKTLPEKFEPEVKDGKILSKIISINGITIIAQNDTDYDPIVIPGSVELGQNEISVARFNRKNFNVSFEITPDRKEKNLTASDALYEASNILPARYFYPENLKIKIAYETATNNCGHYDYNN
ncbi:MAG: hypothetical protein NT030_05615, partial [Candidatus Saganbacteria bacterium]|nr:hypothetical protein [Candidatus Saganbacteria bacterium]